LRVIEPSFEIKSPFGPLNPTVGVQLLQYIEKMARISHRSESGQTEDSWKRFIEAVVLNHGDWSVTEHCNLSVIFRVDRGITHELVRHRLFSFTQESTRFVNYAKKGQELEFIRPIEWENKDNLNQFNFEWSQACAESERTYFNLLALGSRPQEARSVLPNSLAATIAVTGNLRNWRHFLLMRSSKETHPDFRRVVDPLLAEFKKNIPLLFQDIEPGQRQIENMRKAR
jgi:thymidylate synthase (FAD)